MAGECMNGRAAALVAKQLLTLACLPVCWLTSSWQAAGDELVARLPPPGRTSLKTPRTRGLAVSRPIQLMLGLRAGLVRVMRRLTSGLRACVLVVQASGVHGWRWLLKASAGHGEG